MVKLTFKAKNEEVKKCQSIGILKMSMLECEVELSESNVCVGLVMQIHMNF